MKRTLLLTLALLFILSIGASAAVTYNGVTIKAPKSTARALDVKVGTTSYAYLTGSGAFTAVSQVLSGALTAGSAAIGGGYASTGTDITTAGVINTAGVISSGTTGTNGGLTVKSTGAGATTFSVAGATGNTLVEGTLTATGAATLNGGATVKGISAATALAVGNATDETADYIFTVGGGFTGNGEGVGMDSAGNIHADGSIVAKRAPLLITTDTAPTGMSSMQIVVCNHASGAITYTLPTPTSGFLGKYIDIVNVKDAQMTVACATANKMIVAKSSANADLDITSLTFNTANEKIGSAVQAVCITPDNTNYFWWVRNISTNTMTVTDD